MSGVWEDAAKLYFCEAPEMFCGLQNFTQTFTSARGGLDNDRSFVIVNSSFTSHFRMGCKFRFRTFIKTDQADSGRVVYRFICFVFFSNLISGKSNQYKR